MTAYRPRTPSMAHQLKALDICAMRTAFAYFMDTRTGKTKTVIDDMGMLHAAGHIDCVIVVGPNNNQRVWRDQIIEHIDTSLEWHIYMWEKAPTAKYLREELEHFKARQSGLLFFLANIESVNAQAYGHIDDLLKQHRCAIVIDESHRIGYPDAQQTKIMLKFSKRAAYRRIMTGTPDDGDPLRYFSQFYFLDPKILHCNSFTAFKAEYCQLMHENHPLIRHAAMKIAKGDASQAERLKRIIQIPERDEAGRPIYRNLDKLQRLMAPHSFRIKKKDCFDLPPKTFSIRYVSLTKRQRSIYDLVRTQIEAEFVDLEELKRITVSMAITRMLRSQQIVGNHYTADPPEVYDFEEPPIKRQPVRIEKWEDNPRVQAVADIFNEGGKVPTVIWTRFRPEINELLEALGTLFGKKSVRHIDGRVQGEEREAVRKSFQAGELPILVAQTRAGIGFDLWRAETVIYYSNTYSSIDRTQTEDRTDSIQRKHPVAVFDLEGIGTVDRGIVECHKAKKEVSAVLAGGRNLLRVLSGEATNEREVN